MAAITLPLGDLTSEQARALADLARKYTGDTMRTTADQNMLLRWVSEADLPDVYAGLKAIDLAASGAGTISDICACPGTDTCKLGISSSRSLAAELGKQLRASGIDKDPNAKHLHIKASGCFNSCAQHHVADIGFLGVSRNVGGRRVPHFQLVVGGQWENNGGSYGLAIGAVPSKRVPEVVKRLTGRFAKERQGNESFADFANRIGKKTIRAMVEELQVLPTYDQDPSYYSDWGDPREYTISDMGEGECAGEVVPYVEVELAAAERELFEAQVLLDEKKIDGSAGRAFSAMLLAARALTREKNANVGSGADEVVAEFRKHFYDTQLFFDPFARAQVRPVPVPRPRGARQGRQPRGGAPADRRSNAVRGCGPPVLYPARIRAAGPQPAGRRAQRLTAHRPHSPPKAMEAHKLQLKIYLTPESARAVDIEDLIPVFHRWIKQRLLPELTIDVANYRHVPQGPGVVLIGHGSDYFMDEGEGRPGLLHNRKRAGLPPGERLGDLARRHAARGGAARARSGARPARSASRPTSCSSASTTASPPPTATRRWPRCGPSWRRCARRCSPPPSSWRAWAARRSCLRYASPVEPARRWRCYSSARAGRPPRTRRW